MQSSVSFFTDRLGKFGPVIRQVLPPDEVGSFRADPVEFVSGKLLFRGVSRQTLQSLLSTGYMQPQEGEMASVAVFETDSPHYALGGVGKGGALLVIDKARIVGSPMPDGDPQCRCLIEEKLRNPPAGCSRSDYCYLVYNEVDLVSKLVVGHEWHNVQLRKPQPIDEVVFVIIDDGALIDMGKTDQRARLKSLVLQVA